MLLDDATRPKGPGHPVPPVLPRKWTIEQLYPSANLLPREGIIHDPNSVYLHIDQQTWTVSFGMNRQKHNTHVQVEPIYLLLESFNDAKSFDLEYKINAANMPKDVKDTLNVVITLTETDTIV